MARRTLDVYGAALGAAAGGAIGRHQARCRRGAVVRLPGY
jgi:hypothetical protein